MIRFFGFMVMLFSVASFAKTPVVQFPGGHFLGEGKYKISNGVTGTYASFADLDGTEWQLSYVRHGKPMLYNVSLAFDELGLGFFDATISETDGDGNITLHFGEGYCGSEQCHLEFDLQDGRYIEETITLLPAENRIKRLGSLKFADENGDEHTVAWQELMVRIDAGDEKKR